MSENAKRAFVYKWDRVSTPSPKFGGAPMAPIFQANEK